LVSSRYKKHLKIQNVLFVFAATDREDYSATQSEQHSFDDEFVDDGNDDKKSNTFLLSVVVVVRKEDEI